MEASGRGKNKAPNYLSEAFHYICNFIKIRKPRKHQGYRESKKLRC